MDEVESGVAREAGRVILVGAGPGDPEHLTLKAVRALQSADVILYDDLVAGGVLELARREAKRVCVGKRGHGDSCRQDDINHLMVRLARNGRHVVRLKSGDPMIFGRAGEEIELLERNAIPVEVVPGITSASAMAARLGVSLTHRHSAHSVRFVTGHNSAGELASDLDWRALADPRTTLVVYMGGRTVKAFAARVAAEGLSLATPAVAVAGVTWESETRWRGSLGELLREGVPHLSGSPVLIGLGNVFERVAKAAEVAPRAATIDVPAVAAALR
jgi:uroporphyrin-III C-methyltransferase/precorrin-2 dehydrogenase/sirohydrochlorin ferrochelatase